MNPPENLMNLTVVLGWIAAGGGVYVAGVLFSYLAANWPWWNGLPQPVRILVPLLLSIGLAVGSTLLLQQAQLLQIIQPWYAVIITTCLAYTATQKTYFQTIKPLRMEQDRDRTRRGG